MGGRQFDVFMGENAKLINGNIDKKKSHDDACKGCRADKDSIDSILKYIRANGRSETEPKLLELISDVAIGSGRVDTGTRLVFRIYFYTNISTHHYHHIDWTYHIDFLDLPGPHYYRNRHVARVPFPMSSVSTEKLADCLWKFLCLRVISVFRNDKNKRVNN